MKTVFFVFLCLFLSVNAFAQSEAITDDSKVSIEEITLARDDGNNKAGDTTDKFLTTDNPIYCIIQLNSLKSATVKMILVAVKAHGLKPETKSISVSYTTNGNQNRVNFNASPDGEWAAGDYRVDVYIDGKFAQSRAFKIEKSMKEVQSEKQIVPKSFAPRKIIKKAGKN
jgi:hypothetical protein